ncbi:MAG: hypothetical protein AAF333_01175 [Planctomycetota bacterium]
MTATPAPTEFFWETQPHAQRLVDGLTETFLNQHAMAARLARRFDDEAGVRFGDCIDFIAVSPVGKHDGIEQELRDAGFTGPADRLEHHGGIFPIIQLLEGPPKLGIKVDRADDFAATHQLTRPVHGEPGTRMRTVIEKDGDAELWAVERHGWSGFDLPEDSAKACQRAQRWLEWFRTRPRSGDEEQAFERTLELVQQAKGELHRDWVCDLFFQAERDFWMRRNRAAHVQYRRQQRVGIGWANHDHHTYRSSRQGYAGLIAILEALGLHCRERFYPGKGAGWGAQVLEQPVTHIVVFADVDMSPEELQTDFPHLGLAPRDELGTVGLWCGLHGESMLAAGMHHLECTFDFEGLAKQLEHEAGIGMMNPFSSFDHLKQQFTEGERWAVDPARVEKLRVAKLITDAQADTFFKEGAIGSHMENLERNDGFKGFNQNGITDIITETDPRRQTVGSH